MKMGISVGRYLERKTMLVWENEYIIKNVTTCKSLCTWKNYALLSKKNTQIRILGSQSSVPWDPNGVFWLAEKLFTLFAFVALIKMLCS